MSDLDLDNYWQSGVCGLCGRKFAEPTEGSAVCPACDRSVPDVTEALRRITVPEDLLAAVPETLARENHIVPFSGDPEKLTLASDFSAYEEIEKLRFVLNCPVYLVYARTAAILDAIARSYPPK